MSDSDSSQKNYAVVGMGGSFDHFHAGHEHFLRFAAKHADHLLIGVSTEKLIAHKTFPSAIECYEVREQSVKEWCIKNNVSADIFPLVDTFGPTLNDQSIQAVAVTTETVPGGELINTERTKRNLPTLPLLVCDLIQDEKGDDIHASRIRAGEISRQGDVYNNIFKNGYRLREKQREYFSRPQGPVSTSPVTTSLPGDVFRCAVGDFTVEHCVTHHIPFAFGVIDHKQQREVYQSPVLSELPHDFSVNNAAGEISLELVEILSKILRGKSEHQNTHTTYLHVNGEEDLAAVALFLLLPLGCEVWYGQPNEGTVIVTITETFKKEVYKVLCQSE
jgi:pantetheine-phosphate adenylyltransferase